MEQPQVAYFLNEYDGNYLFQYGEEVLCVPVDSLDVASTEPHLVCHNNLIIQLEINPDPEQTQSPDEVVTVESDLDDGAMATQTWSDAATLLFISLYKEKKSLVEKRKILNLKTMWEKISTEMKNDNYFFTPLQCENKWKSLSRGYTNLILNNKKTGRGRKSCPYQRELTDIFQKRNHIFPPAVMGVGQPIERGELMAMSGVSSLSHQMPSVTAATGSPFSTQQPTEQSPEQATEQSSSPPMQPSLHKKAAQPKRGIGRSVVNELADIRKLIADRHTRKKALDETKLEQSKIKNDLLKALLDEIKKKMGQCKEL